MSKIISVDWGWKEEKLVAWDGKKMKTKLPKPKEGMVIVTENMPIKLARPFLEAGILVLRCTGNASADHRTSLGFEKDHTPLGDKNDAWFIRDLYKTKPEVFRPMKPPSSLSLLYVNYQQLTKQIAGVKNRQWASEDDDNKEYLVTLEVSKNLLLKKMKKKLKKYKIWTEFLSKIDGIGPALAAGIISEIKDISKFDNVSNLNAYAGLHLKDGRAVRRKKGEVYPVNSALKSLFLELIPSQFIRQRTPVYRGLYDAEKARSLKILEEDKNKPKDQQRVENKIHVERRAKRKAAKIFVHHVWKKWRELEGLPVPQPWVLAHGGHTHEILPPTDYPGLDEKVA